MQDILVNGQRTSLLDVHDRGLQFGDGLFETIAVRAGRPCLWKRHMRRLQAGADRLSIDLPPLEQLHEEALQLSKGQADAVLKLIVTRGPGRRGYRVPDSCRSTRILMRSAAPEYPTDWQRTGVRVQLCSTPLGINPALAGIKHLNRLEQVMARAEWSAPFIAEGLVSDIDGNIIEGTASNLFVQQGSQMITPRLERCGVQGVLRGLVMDCATEKNCPIQESTLTIGDLLAADALYLTNSIIGVWRVRFLDDHEYDTTRPAHMGIVAAQQAAFQP